MKDKSKTLSIIEKGMLVEGMVNGKGRLVINGTVNGSLKGDTIIISEQGRVFAEAEADAMTIGGIFDGKAQTKNTLEILSTGKCSGEIQCKDLVVEAGAVLNAKVVCRSVDEKKL